jgi:hypothetical protein
MIAQPGLPPWQSQDRARAGKALQQLCSALLGDELLAFVEKATGTVGLRAEPDGDWGSYRPMGSGAVHHARAGSNRHPETGRPRRYSLFTYIDENWRPEFGGWLELGAPDSDEPRTRLLPEFTRSVLIETIARSLHGVSEVLTAQPTTRKTVTVHFWSDEDGASAGSWAGHALADLAAVAGFPQQLARLQLSPKAEQAVRVPYSPSVDRHSRRLPRRAETGSRPQDGP